MKEVMKKADKSVVSKLGLWIVGLVGFKGILVVVLITVFLSIIIAISGGHSANKMNDEQSVGNGMYVCSPTGEIDREKWDSVFDDQTRSGKLTGYGDKIIKLSNEKGIDPVLFASISLHETAWGTSSAIKNYNNPGGLMGSSGLMRFATLDEGLESMARTLYNRIIVDGLVTVEDLGSVYAPVGAANDPNNLNANWVPTTKQIADKLGGLTMNCDMLSDFDFDFTDVDVSQLRKNIARVGHKWIGNSTYVFGGGRNQVDISRGHFDCSSFVHWAYKQNGIDLGNLTSVSTETLNKLGKKISINDVRIGDLIFWDSYKRDGHVGIYVGNGQFIGAQSSTGVSIVSLSNSYWNSVFSGHVRRIIED